MARRNGIRKPYHLTGQFVKTITRPGVYGDGRGGSGLQLRVHRTASGDVSKSWRQKIKVNGRQTFIGHGSYPFVDLAEARRRAVVAKGKALSGIDPRTDAPIASQPKPKPEPKPTGVTFGEAAEAMIQINREQWRKGSTTEPYWRRLLLGLPIHKKDVNEITSADIIRVVRPIWNKTPRKAADQLRCIRAVMNWSIAHGHRSDADPTTAVRDALPKQRRQTQHYAALKPSQIPAAMRKLATCTKSRNPIIRLAIRFCWLTATRPGEATSATWADIDMRGRRWTIPATKNGKTFSVPLSDRALAILREAVSLNRTDSGLVFPNRNGNRISGKTLKSCLALCGIENATVHGTSRAGFRVWAAENGIDHRLAEMCLHHDIGSETERAYQRSDLFEQRKAIMQRWADFVSL